MAEGARIEVSLMMDSDDMTKKGNYPPEKETIRSTSKMIKEIPFVSNTSSYESDETNPRESEVPKKKREKKPALQHALEVPCSYALHLTRCKLPRGE